jgi:transketolase
MDKREFDQLAVNSIRFLAVDMIEKAGSGHPGLPLGMAAPAYVLMQRVMRHNPADPGWINRDRFILSAGHGSALLYALLFVHGYDLSLQDLKQFRQLGSRTPGHPEYRLTPGVEATTGPLGHGLAMAVGMAVSQRLLASQFNRPGFNIFDNHIYALVSDGDLMEGVAAEAVSLAGSLQLDRLTCVYDQNHISIEGSTDLSFREDVGARFRACGWQVLRVEDSEDMNALESAVYGAHSHPHQPSLIMVNSHIGRGSPKQDSAASHGEPLGAEALRAPREFYNWNLDPFQLPEPVLALAAQVRHKGQLLHNTWRQLLASYQAAYPELAQTLARQMAGEMPPDWQGELPAAADKKISTRAACGQALNALNLPNLAGGAADLAPSTKSRLEKVGDFSYDDNAPCGRNLHFGVREHAMGAVANGMALYGGVLPYAATFLVFSDFMRPSLRLAALMGLKVVFLFTHDSVAVGEDGPTHQPIEQLMSLRLIPGLTVIRPADARETFGAWRAALTTPGPCALILSRQDLSPIPASCPVQLEKGAYSVSPEQGPLQGIIIASGSEVALALAVKEKLAEAGQGVRVVSMPSWELFARQPQEYQHQIIPLPGQRRKVWRVSLEAGVTSGWEKWVGTAGPGVLLLGIDRFGASAPGPEAYAHCGLELEAIVARIKALPV